MMACP